MSTHRCFGGVLAASLLLACSASAAPVPVYDSTPSPLPGSFPSLGYEATSTDEFGDSVTLEAGGRALRSVVVVLTNWSCGNDYVPDADSWLPGRSGTEACETDEGAGFLHPITLNIYEVDHSGVDPALGPLFASKTIEAFVPFRPSWDPDLCYTGSPAGGLSPADDIPFGGTWYDPVLDACVHGYNAPISFDFSADGLTLPDEVVVAVEYDTSHHGNTPIGANGPYNSLNVGLVTEPPTVGEDSEPGTVYWDTTVGGWYCDGGVGGTDFLRRDAGCWFTGGVTGDPYTLAMSVNVAPTTIAIDLRPNNLNNQVNTGAKQLVPVAILGAEGFDPTAEVDIESIVAHGASPSSTRFDEEDVNGDGYLDLVVYFRARDFDDPSPEECDDPSAMFTLEGSLMSGGGFAGTDLVTWLGC